MIGWSIMDWAKGLTVGRKMLIQRLLSLYHWVSATKILYLPFRGWIYFDICNDWNTLFIVKVIIWCTQGMSGLEWNCLLEYMLHALPSRISSQSGASSTVNLRVWTLTSRALWSITNMHPGRLSRSGTFTDFATVLGRSDSLFWFLHF